VVTLSLFLVPAWWVSGCSDNSMAHMNPDLEKLFSTSSDFDLCDGVFMRICKQHQGEHVVVSDNYTVEERTVVLVWHVSGIIDNGGFEYLFEGEFPGDPDYRLTSQAFQPIRSERAVTAFREALSVFPKGQ